MSPSPTGISRRSVRISTAFLLGAAENARTIAPARPRSGDLTKCQIRRKWRRLRGTPGGEALANPNLETLEVNVISAEFAAEPQPVYRELVTKCPFARQMFTSSPVL